jgi:hypothetical protein
LVTIQDRLQRRVGRGLLIAALAVLVAGTAVAIWLWTREFVPPGNCSGPPGTCLAYNEHAASIAIALFSVLVASRLLMFGAITGDEHPRVGPLPKP